MTTRQRQILEFVRQNGEITVADCAQVFGAHYFANARKHAGTCLARLVAARALVRAGRGRYIAAPPPPFLRRSLWFADHSQGTVGRILHVIE